MMLIRAVTMLFFSFLFLLSSLNYSQTVSYGDSANLGNGQIKCWVQTTVSGDPEIIGVSVTETVLSSLPPGTQNFSLDLPAAANDSLFKHIFFGWNPSGHPPTGVYNLPHFDIHYYIISKQERETIAGGPDTFTVSPEYVAPDYVPDPSAVPQMGTHWTDTTSAEFNGETFTKTHIYGYYHGKMIFYEPMVTIEYLQINPDTAITIKQPAAFHFDGYYPTTYTIRYDAGLQEYHFTIKDFVYRTGTPVSVQNNELSPDRFYLAQNYPNPFNPSTKIRYILPEAAKVKLAVYDILGNEIASLIEKEQNAGNYEVEFDGSLLTSGVYIYKLTAGNFVQSKKLILIK